MSALEPAVAVASRIDRLIAERWRVEDGLPQNTVNAIVQTRDGYLWLATFDGLARFDGVRFTVFHTGNTKGLGSGRIVSLLEGRDGTLWIGTEGGGVSRYRGGHFEPLTCQGASLLSAVHDLCEDREGGVWLGSERGLARFDGDRLTVFTAADGLSGNVGAVFTPRRGGVWLATDRGLARFEGKRFTVLDVDDGLPSISVSSVEVDAGGAVWIGTDKGLARLKGGTLTIFTTKDGLPSKAVTSVLEDRAGTLWVATSGGGLTRLTGGRFEIVARPPAIASSGSVRAQFAAHGIIQGGDGSLWLLAGDLVERLNGGEVTSYRVANELMGLAAWSAMVDREGSLWIGTNGAGLHRLKPALVTAFTKGDGLLAKETYAILESGSGEIWIGTHGDGLGRFDGRTLRTFTVRDGLPSDLVWALCEAKGGGLWIGTWGGLRRMSKGRVNAPLAKNGPWSETILALREDRSGGLWIGTRGRGLYYLKDGGLTAYTTKDGLVNDYVRTILEDRAGDIWIATDGGVSHLADGKFTNTTTKEGLSDSFVRSLYEDRDGALWFGTYGNGLNRLKHGKLTAITSKDGLYDHTVSQILEDDQGTFWMTSNKGIYRVAKRELDDFADGKIRSISCVSYGKSEGMKEAECNGGSQPAGCKSKDGRLWFPTAGGVVMIDPKRAPLNPLPPPVVIEEASVDGRSVDVTTGAHLTPGAQRLQIRYSGLSFANPGKVRFKYRLEGFDVAWVDAGTRREAVYTNLGPGTYRFRVLACNNDGVWNKGGASWELVMRPFFYQTRLFFVLCTLAAAGALFVLHREIVARLRARNAVLLERARIAREIHDGLAQGLVSVIRHLRRATASSSVAEAGAGDAADEDGDVAQALSLAEGSLGQARQLARDMHSGTMPSVPSMPSVGVGLPDILETLVREVGRAAGIDSSFRVDGRPRRLPSRLQTNLLRVAQEALSNAVTHSGCTSVSVVLIFRFAAVRLEVRDDGRGFDEAARSPGLGLRTMKERARSHWGKLTVSPSPQGTNVAVEVPRFAGWLGWLLP